MAHNFCLLGDTKCCSIVFLFDVCLVPFLFASLLIVICVFVCIQQECFREMFRSLLTLFKFSFRARKKVKVKVKKLLLCELVFVCVFVACPVVSYFYLFDQFTVFKLVYHNLNKIRRRLNWGPL